MAFSQKTWVTGETITADELNRIETGIGATSGSGGGLLVYNTLSDLQSAYPGGVAQPAWIISENNWYYWSGTITAPNDTTAPILTITAGGTFTGTKSVVLSTNETATIYYTLDGSNPTTGSAIYTNVLSVNATTTLKAFAKDTTGNQSSIQTVTYTLDATAPADTTAPVLTITPSAIFTGSQTVTMSTNEAATIWYTLDDTDPVSSGTRLQYTSPLTLTETDTVKAYAVDSASNASATQTVTYTKQAAVTDSYTLNFNGSTSIATSANNIGITGAQARSIEVRFRVAASGVNQALVSWGTNVANQLCELGVYNGNIVFMNYNLGFVTTSQAAALNTWIHAIFTFDGTTATWYLNGTLARGQAYANMATVDSTVKLGSGTMGKLNGDIDFVRIYNRALTATEVTNNKNGNAVRSGLVDEWLINEGTGTTITDTAGTNHMTTSNATWASNA